MRLRSFLLLLGVPVALLVAGTSGYVAIEGWPLFDALYMTVITLTTVGFLEVHPLSTAGRAFTMLLALGGVFMLFYAATAIIRAVVTGEVGGDLGRKRMLRRLAELRDHFIVCGYGRMGRRVCQEFSAAGVPFVLVERDEALTRDFALPHGFALAGDATSDDVLRQAGVERARGLVTVAASDADNLYITMSARFLNDKLAIVARAEEDEAEKKLVRAGADRVISPYVIGGHRVAQALLRPHTLEFLDFATRRDYLDLQIDQNDVPPGSPLAGAVLKDSRLRQDLGVIIVAIRKPDGRMVFNPAPECVLEARDVLITLGRRDQLDRLHALAAPR